MPDPRRLRANQKHLAEADRDIANGERRVTAQVLRIEQLSAGRRDTRTARELLAALEQTLATWVVHRSAIAQEIAPVSQPGPPFLAENKRP